MTWVVVIFNALMLVWVIGGASTASTSVAKNCADEVGDAYDLCKSATNVGTGLGVAALITLWVFGDVILGVLWLVTNRSSKRDCPACGSAVKRGLIVCPTCNYNFAAITAESTSIPTPASSLTPPPGWYADPQHAGNMRYWDGSNWTGYTQEGGAQPPATV